MRVLFRDFGLASSTVVCQFGNASMRDSWVVMSEKNEISKSFVENISYAPQHRTDIAGTNDNLPRSRTNISWTFRKYSCASCRSKKLYGELSHGILISNETLSFKTNLAQSFRPAVLGSFNFSVESFWAKESESLREKHSCTKYLYIQI